MENVSQFQLKKIQTDLPRVEVTKSEVAADFAKQFYFDDIEIYESFFIICLDRSNHTIGYAKISQGGVSGTVVDAKLVFKYAIDNLSSHLILVHNHPSGNLKPSKQDLILTEKIIDGGKLLDIKVLDHIILTKNSHYSLADEGYM